MFLVVGTSYDFWWQALVGQLVVWWSLVVVRVSCGLTQPNKCFLLLLSLLLLLLLLMLLPWMVPDVIS